MLWSIRLPNGKTVRVAGNPVKTPGLETPPPRYPPGLGEHTEEILSRRLGYDPEYIQELFESKVVK
jgi:crotonobetainyl-CoA:carnitine CoA-transferase CaiB-like acyl-CoA transferase